MNGMQTRAADDWKVKQMKASVEHGTPLLTRLQDAASLRLTSKFFVRVQEALTDSSKWQAMPPVERTSKNASLAFASLSRAACGVKQNIHDLHNRHPVKLWLLLGPNAASVEKELETDPDHLKTKFSRAFLSYFKGRLRSDECLGFLLASGDMLQLEIIKIECRHAAFRRILCGSITWRKLLGGMSGDFMLLRQRLLEVGSCFKTPGYM